MFSSDRSSTMIRTITVAVFAAGILAACSPGEPDNAEGPVVSGAEGPMNSAVDTTPTTGETTMTPGASSFTEGQARGAMANAGYTDIGPLTQNEQGVWQAEAMKSGTRAMVSVDYKGAVTPQ